MNFAVRIRAHPTDSRLLRCFIMLASQHFGAEFRFFSNFQRQARVLHTIVRAHVIQLGV